jgi:excisionase family DNA binding protein
VPPSVQALNAGKSAPTYSWAEVSGFGRARFREPSDAHKNPTSIASAHDERGRNPLLLTVQEVADLLRTSPKAVYVMVQRGALPGVVRIGRRLLLRRDALLDWLRRKSAPSLER